MPNKPWRMYLIFFTLWVVFMGLFIRFVSWLLGSKPIGVINNYSLDNLPAPESALSFAIKHGSAMYFKEPIPRDAPKLSALVVASFIITLALLVALGIKRKSLENAS